jgi:hypothetical protein
MSLPNHVCVTYEKNLIGKNSIDTTRHVINSYAYRYILYCLFSIFFECRRKRRKYRHARRVYCISWPSSKCSFIYFVKSQGQNSSKDNHVENIEKLNSSVVRVSNVEMTSLTHTMSPRILDTDYYYDDHDHDHDIYVCVCVALSIAIAIGILSFVDTEYVSILSIIL